MINYYFCSVFFLAKQRLLVTRYVLTRLTTAKYKNNDNNNHHNNSSALQ